MAWVMWNPNAAVAYIEPTEGGAPNEKTEACQKVRCERKSEEPQGKEMVDDEHESRCEDGRPAWAKNNLAFLDEEPTKHVFLQHRISNRPEHGGSNVGVDIGQAKGLERRPECLTVKARLADKQPGQHHDESKDEPDGGRCAIATVSNRRPRP